jgi:hypothetical protein
MACNCAKTYARFIKNGVHIIQINICRLKPRRLIPLLEPLTVNELCNSYPLQKAIRNGMSYLSHTKTDLMWNGG